MSVKRERPGKTGHPVVADGITEPEVRGLMGPLPLAPGPAVKRPGCEPWPLPALSPTRYAPLPARLAIDGIIGRRAPRDGGRSPLRAAVSLFSRPGWRAHGRSPCTAPVDDAVPPIVTPAADEDLSGRTLPVGAAPAETPPAGGGSPEATSPPGGVQAVAAPDVGEGVLASGGGVDGEGDHVAPAEPVGDRPFTEPGHSGRDEGEGKAAEGAVKPAVGDDLVCQVGQIGEVEEAGPAEAEETAEGAEGVAAGKDVSPGRASVTGRARGVLGVDIGSRWLKVVQAEISGGILTVWRCGTWPVPEGAVAGGLIQDLAGVASLLREARSLFRGRHCVGAVDGQRVISRQVQLPAMGRRELEAMLRLQGEHYLPLPWSDTEMDFTILDQSEHQMKVLLVAAHSTAVRALAHVVERAGLVPLALETDSAALARVLELTGSSYPTPDPQPVLTIGVHVGAMGTLVFASRQGTPFLARILPVGGQHFTEVLGRELGIAEEAAETYKRERGLEIPELRPLAERLAGEISKTVEYYLDQSERGFTPRILLTGGGARLYGLCDVLAPWLEQALARWGRLPAGARCISLARVPEARVRWACDPLAFGPEHFLALGLSLRESKR
ncbi:MAG: type IV pilus assembly protein PilM [Bacillota bacterium]